MVSSHFYFRWYSKKYILDTYKRHVFILYSTNIFIFFFYFLYSKTWHVILMWAQSLPMYFRSTSLLNIIIWFLGKWIIHYFILIMICFCFLFNCYFDQKNNFLTSVKNRKRKIIRAVSASPSSGGGRGGIIRCV